jgi:hypothetical protein
VLKDPKVRSIYIGTKLAVFLLAALATWPLARVIGPKAWVGLGVFGFVLTLLTLVVVFGGSVRASTPTPPRDELEDEDDFDPEQPVTIPTEDFIDLHPFAPREIPDVVEAYLEAAVENGFSEVRLIHGKGIGVQRDRVQKLLAKHPLVSSYRDAPAERGGWGATIAWLEQPRDS